MSSMSAPQQYDPTSSNQVANKKKIPKRLKGVKGVSEQLFQNTIGRVKPPQLPSPPPEVEDILQPDIFDVDAGEENNGHAVGFPSPMNESLARQHYPRPAPRVVPAHVPTLNTGYPSLPTVPALPQSALYSEAQIYPTAANASPPHGAHFPDAPAYGLEGMPDPQYSEYIQQPIPYVDFTPPYVQSPLEQARMYAQHSGNGHTNSSDFRAAPSTSGGGFGDNAAGYYPSTNASPYGASSEYDNDFDSSLFFCSEDYGISPQTIEGGQGDMYRYDSQDGCMPNHDGSNSGYVPDVNGQLYPTFSR